MELRYLDITDKKDLDKWDSFVEMSQQGSIFSKTWYLDALQVKYKILTVQEKDFIRGGIVLAKNEIGTFSNPMLDKYLGVLFEPYEQLTQKVLSKQYAIMTLLAEELKKYKTFDYYFHPNFTNWIPFYWNGFAQQTRYTYRINLIVPYEDLRENYHYKLRNDIKNAIKNNVTLKKNIPFESFYEIINKTFVKQGNKAPFSINKIQSFIEDLEKRNKFISFGAYNKDKDLIAVGGLIFDAKASYLILNGIDINKHIRGANALMLDEAIRYFNKKIIYFDFEGSMLPGVEQFYRRFGGELIPYMRIWNDNFFNYFKSKAKVIYKKMRYGR